MPETCEGLYRIALDRISAQGQEWARVAISALKWITFSKELLPAAALQHALSVQGNGGDINFDNVMDLTKLVAVCGGLITFDQESDVIRLVHYTTQRYLERVFSGDVEIARTCLSYLSNPAFSEPFTNEKQLKDHLQKYKLSDYASRYWSEHVRAAAEGQFHSEILQAFGRQGTRDAVFQLAEYSSSEVWYWYRHPPNITILHFASIYGLSNLCQSLLDNHHRSERVY